MIKWQEIYEARLESKHYELVESLFLLHMNSDSVIYQLLLINQWGPIKQKSPYKRR